MHNNAQTVEHRHLTQSFYTQAALSALGIIGAQTALTAPQQSHSCHQAMVHLMGEMQSGISKYQNASRTKPHHEWHEIATFKHARVWRVGASQLQGRGMLLVPSFINSAAIFDILPQQSLAQSLIQAGMTPYILEWLDDGAQSYQSYIDDGLDMAINTISDMHDGCVSALGYCLGGTVLALSSRLDQLGHCVFAAAPWDFERLPMRLPPIEINQATIPADQIHMACILADPLAGFHKFSRFSKQGDAGKSAIFIAIEDWLADGRPLPSCLLDLWHKKAWQDDVNVPCPTLIVLPERDHLVPYDAAIGLQDRCLHAQIFKPATGHIGFIASHRAHDEIWARIVAFLA